MATVEKLEHNKAKLTITVEPAVFADAMQKAYIKTAKQFNIPGFRKGKAPRKVIESMYGEGVFYEDAFELVYDKAYFAAIEEHKLDTVDRPDISIEQIGSEQGVVFTAEVQLFPEVSLGAYEGIEVVRRAYTLKDEELDALLEQEREKAARYIEVERSVEDGDQVTLDYSGSVDGVKFDGGTAEDQQLTIGSGTFIPGFEEQLVGMAIGESRDITVTFPEEYHSEQLKGKEAVFAVAIKGIQVKELPALDDEFAKEISEFDTLEELRADKREKLEARNEQRAKNEMEDEALQKAANNATVEIPDVMIERQMDQMLRDMDYRLSGSGLSLEDYCKYVGMDMDMLRATYRDGATNRVKLQLVLEAISKEQNIQADEDSLSKEIEEFAKQSGGNDVEAFRSRLSEDDLNYFRDRIIAQKTVQFIVEHAVQVDAPEEPATEQTDTAAE